MPDVWEHDMYDDGPSPALRSGPISTGAGKLLIESLDFGVNDADIQVCRSYIHVFFFSC